MGKEKNAMPEGDDEAQGGFDSGPPGAASVNSKKSEFYQEVKIDKHVYNVNYGSREEFNRLLEECATRAFTNIPRPGQPSRNFFQCIHCGNKSFTNKMRLNSHRFTSQCPAQKDDMGNNLRLLPYPDMGIGQGKVSEAIRKGKAFDKEASIMRNKDQMAGGVKGKGAKQSVSEEQEGEQAKGMKRTFVAEEGAVRLSPMKHKDEEQPLRGNTRVRSHQVAQGGEKTVRPAKRRAEEKHVGENVKARKTKAVRQREDSPSVAPSESDRVDSETDESAGDFVVMDRKTKKTTALDEAPRPRSPRQKRKPAEHNRKKEVPGPKTSMPIQGLATEIPPAKGKIIPGSDPVWGERGGKPAEALGQKRKGSSAAGAVHESDVGIYTKRRRASPTPLSIRSRRRVVSSEDSGEGNASSQNTAPSLTQSPRPSDAQTISEEILAEELCGLATLNEAAEIDQALDAAFAAVDSMGHNETLGCNEHADWSSPDLGTQNEETMHTHPSKTTSDAGRLHPLHSRLTTNSAKKNLPPYRKRDPDSPVLVRPLQTKYPDQTKYPEHRMQIVSWTGNYEGVHALQRYWMCGLGTPTPKMYYPELASTTSGRAERLRRDEREVRMAARVKADAVATSRPKLAPPVPLPTPDLYHLLKARPQLLDWSWEGQSKNEFDVEFKRFWAANKVQIAARECGMWWLCEAKEEDYPDLFQAIGRAVTSLCSSVKYGKVPHDIEVMGDYLQYVHDLMHYQERCRTAAVDLKAEQERIVTSAVEDFRYETRLKREACVWDWCPIWIVLQESKHIFGKLPSLPWRHDDEEAEEVRCKFLEDRVHRIPPTPFVQVLRIVLQNVYGRWRQMTCPLFGIRESVVRSICKKHRDLMLALAVYTYEARFRFSGMALFEAEVVHVSIMKDVEMICAGKEDRVMDHIMKWVRNVRLRALQDLARDFPAGFRQCWTTTVHEHWSDQGKLWSKTLRQREDLDMGWVADENAPRWASKVTAARRAMQEIVNSMEKALEEDEDAVWAQYYATALEDDETLIHETVQDTEGQKDPPVLHDNMTLSQVQKSVHVEDICTQDLTMHELPPVQTPPTLIGLVHAGPMGCDESFEVMKATPRSLVEDFGTPGRPTRDAYLEADCSCDELTQEPTTIIPVDPESARRVSHRKTVTFAPLPNVERDSAAWCRLSIPKTFDYFQIEELMEALPRKGRGDKDTGTITFFGGEWESVPVPVTQLANLRRCRKFLGQNTIELLCRRLWWSMSRASRAHVYIASSFMQGTLQRAWDVGTERALLRWGQNYFVPSRIYSTCPSNMEVLVPYVCGSHWSLFIFKAGAVLHLDSSKIHDEQSDAEYVSRLWKVWWLMHEPRLGTQPKTEQVKTFLRRGNYECGFFVLRFMELYVRLLHGDDPIADEEIAKDMFLAGVQLEERGPALQKNVIAAVADELRETAIALPYEPPYRVCYDRDASSGSITILPNGGDDDVESSPQ